MPAQWEPTDCSPPGSSLHGILQARILEWVATPSSRRSSPPRDRTHVSSVSCIGRSILYHWVTWEASPKATSLNSIQQRQRPAPCFKVGHHLQSLPWLASAAADPWSASSSWSVPPPPGCWLYRHFPVNPANKSLSPCLFPVSLTQDTFLKLKSPPWNTEKTVNNRVKLFVDFVMLCLWKGPL